jgi:hypothetical protein
MLHKVRGLCRWQDDIKLDVKEVGYEGVDWIRLAQNRDQCGGFW